MAAKWNFVVLVSLEFRLADHGDVAADHATLTVDRAAAAKHMGRDHHSCHLQCGWVYHRDEWSWHLAACPGDRPGRGAGTAVDRIRNEKSAKRKLSRTGLRGTLKS